MEKKQGSRLDDTQMGSRAPGLKDNPTPISSVRLAKRSTKHDES
jgi:hypothetical protein